MNPRIPSPGFNRLFAFILLLGLVNASLGYMYYEGKTSDITTLELKGAPHDIVFIADPHLRPSNLEHTREIIDKINALHPSLVLIGGDFVYGDGEDFSLQEVWREIDAPVYAVLGNHDYKAGITASSAVQKMIAVREAKLEPGNYDVSNFRDGSTDLAFADALAGTLESDGVHVLRNEYQEMVIDGKAVTIVGVDDGWAGMADPPVIENNESFVIYLIHEPDCRAQWDADLILSGHTHGGQFVLAGDGSAHRCGNYRIERRY